VRCWRAACARPQETHCQLRKVVLHHWFSETCPSAALERFRRVYDHGTRYSGPLFAASASMNRSPMASNRLHDTPCARQCRGGNRIKRRLRGRPLSPGPLNPQWSIVINPRRKAFDAPSGVAARSGTALSPLQWILVRCSAYTSFVFPCCLACAFIRAVRITCAKPSSDTA